MYRIPVCRYLGEKPDIPIRDPLAQVPTHADLEILDADRATRIAVMRASVYRADVMPHHGTDGSSIRRIVVPTPRPRNPKSDFRNGFSPDLKQSRFFT